MHDVQCAELAATCIAAFLELTAALTLMPSILCMQGQLLQHHSVTYSVCCTSITPSGAQYQFIGVHPCQCHIPEGMLPVSDPNQQAAPGPW